MPNNSHVEAADRAAAGLAALESATAHLLGVVANVDAATARMPSRLPGWSRAHVVTHLARNADALVNLLTWARTGVEHPMYASGADRDADIEEGAGRPWRLLQEDLDAACTRFADAARGLSRPAWRFDVVGGRGTPLKAHDIPLVRLREVWVHLVDLDRGVDFADIPPPVVEDLIDEALREHVGGADVPALRVAVTLPGGGQRTWELARTGEVSSVVRGTGASVLAWLAGRDAGAELVGQPPSLPSLI